MKYDFVVNSTKAFVSEKDKVPTIHFLDTVMEIKCSFRIDRPEYVNSFEGEKKVEDELDKEWIVERLSEKSEEFPEYTVYELAKGLWNLNSDIKVSKMEMPNYLELK